MRYLQRLRRALAAMGIGIVLLGCGGASNLAATPPRTPTIADYRAWMEADLVAYRQTSSQPERARLISEMRELWGMVPAPDIPADVRTFFATYRDTP